MPLLATLHVEHVAGHPQACLSPLDALALKQWLDELAIWRQKYNDQCKPAQFDPAIAVEPWELD